MSHQRQYAPFPEQQQQCRREPWRNRERHYCAVCNAWMGSDRQSVLLHENGKKHRENVEKSRQEKRCLQRQQEQEAAELQRSLKLIENTAMQAVAQDYATFASSSPATTAAAVPPVGHRGFAAASAVAPMATTSTSSILPPPPPPPPPPPNQNKKQEKQEWESRKKLREEERAKAKRVARGEEEEEADQDEGKKKRRKKNIPPDLGHYMFDGKTYLEGSVFGEGVAEEDMPVQLWTGHASACDEEKRLPEREIHWKDGLIAAVRKRKRRRRITVKASDAAALNDEGNELEVVVDVAYLRSPDDAEETMETSVPVDRIRILLGNPNDDRIPETLEEARLMAVGGEEEISVNDEDAVTGQEVDENTGLSGWSTVQIKRTTVRQEVKKERERLRRQRREKALREEKVAKEIEARKMEEAVVANADDSALGAYDVWSRGDKEGYKGVNIHDDGGNGGDTAGDGSSSAVQVHDILGKKLAEGKGPVAFKKKKGAAFKGKKNKKQNRRTTSADDDD